jgi:dTDP-4-dehydrorhamnose reductase
MKRIFLTGATGQIGWELARTLMAMGQVIIPARDRYDLERPESLRPLLDAVRPDVILNAGAYTAVDKAEEEPERVLAINAVAPAVLSMAARRHNALLVHYSTDYVFDGSKPDPYDEDDAAYPASAYGQSKLSGEEVVRASGCDFLIFRTSWVYAARGNNFLKTILRLAHEQEELRIVSDQVGAPTWARLIADVTALALQQDLALRSIGQFESGIFHLTASGETSWHGFATAIVNDALERGASLKCRTITPISTAEYPCAAARPANSRLSGARLAARYGLGMPGWERCMRYCMAELFP